MKHPYKRLLIATYLPLCWLMMMTVHEMGHAISAFLSGGAVTKLVLHPLAISRTDVDPNPHPLFVVWSGPLIGVLLPLILWALAHWLIRSIDYLFRFFVGFCLIANGAYLGIGSFDAVGDAGEMLRLRTPIGYLWLFGLIAIPCGFRIWHRLGPRFGLGPDPHDVDSRHAIGVSTLLLVAVVIMSVFK